MNFITYKVDKPNNLKKMKKVKPSFFKRGSDASVFLYNEKANGLTHLILKLNDEYLIRTKLFNEYTAIPFDHYVNVFFSLENSNIFIEESLSAYLEVAVEFLEIENKINIERKTIDSDSFFNLTERFSAESDITRLEYLNKETDEEETLNFVSLSEFKKLFKENIQIDFMNWRFKDFYASANRNGKIKLDNSNDEFLVKWLGVFSNEV